MISGRNLGEIVDSLRGLKAQVAESGSESALTSERFGLVRDFLRAEADREVPELWLARAGALALGGENAPVRTILATLVSGLRRPAMGIRGSASSRQVTYQADEYMIQMLVEGLPDGRKSRVTGQLLGDDAENFLGVPPVVLAEHEGKVLASTFASDLGEFDLAFPPRRQLQVQFALMNGREMIIVPLGFENGHPDPVQ